MAAASWSDGAYHNRAKTLSNGEGGVWRGERAYNDPRKKMIVRSYKARTLSRT